MATNGFSSKQQPPISVENAFLLLFQPEDVFDTQDGLVMFDRLDARGELDARTRARLRERLRKHSPVFLAGVRQLVWGSEPPPSERFWWFEPGEWVAGQEAA